MNAIRVSAPRAAQKKQNVKVKIWDARGKAQNEPLVPSLVKKGIEKTSLTRKCIKLCNHSVHGERGEVGWGTLN